LPLLHQFSDRLSCFTQVYLHLPLSLTHLPRQLSMLFCPTTAHLPPQAKVSSSAQTADGNAQSIAGALALSGINAIATAKSTAAAVTGDVDSDAEAYAFGAFHGEANADSAAATGCKDCDSTSTATALSTGIIADSTARSKADSPQNPGQSIANAMAFGVVSRTSNSGQARVAIGPAQALTGGLSVSAPLGAVTAVNKAASAVAAAAAAAQQAQQGNSTAAVNGTASPEAVKQVLLAALNSLIPKPVVSVAPRSSSGASTGGAKVLVGK
jgi:hypothetical protein